jgi:hypothetical protein
MHMRCPLPLFHRFEQGLLYLLNHGGVWAIIIMMTTKGNHYNWGSRNAHNEKNVTWNQDVTVWANIVHGLDILAPHVSKNPKGF